MASPTNPRYTYQPPEMTAPALKSCPFCGGVAEYAAKQMTTNGYDGVAVRARCSRCHAQSPYKRNAWLHGWHETLEDAAEAWNRRHTDD